ncbi:hypothetical protein K469DRAFT_690761 [Zopfia rhizophila CBS 207.26]|uniref:Uncharacterized protein n=1 Tax=Zopfia rhizophila CBS 207.26 TaxID=1314779 RepID=A0A6A6DWV9_9PEZI|nr:hypothetical protein K469DRAFT_690761 [Zopfia rhizophila CBS 207.26]
MVQRSYWSLIMHLRNGTNFGMVRSPYWSLFWSFVMYASRTSPNSAEFVPVCTWAIAFAPQMRRLISTNKVNCIILICNTSPRTRAIYDLGHPPVSSAPLFLVIIMLAVLFDRHAFRYRDGGNRKRSPSSGQKRVG